MRWPRGEVTQSGRCLACGHVAYYHIRQDGRDLGCAGPDGRCDCPGYRNHYHRTRYPTTRDLAARRRWARRTPPPMRRERTLPG